MGELFRSAMSYLSQAGGASASGRSHPLVGTTVKMSGVQYRVRSLLAEGGYALVFAVQDAQDNWFALKRQLAVDSSAAQAIFQEIKFMRELSGHPNIVRYTQATRQELKDQPGRMEFLMLMELCTGGSLIDVLQKDMLNVEKICKIFYAVCSAVQHMHDRSPPITHRDIKIENLLFDAGGFIRLCDFGSATTDIFRPDDNWSVSKRNLLEEEMAKYTTPMYRAPEILDTYQNHPIGPAQDVWALGCILYYLCYRQHPFEDSAKLRIINAKYTLPDADRTSYAMFHTTIRNTLQPNPYSRPTIGDLCDQIRDLARIIQVNLDTPVFSVNSAENATTNNNSDFIASFNNSTNTPYLSQQQPLEGLAAGAQQQASEMFSQLKGQGISFFKNFKDKSTAVMQNVQLGTSLISGMSGQNATSLPTVKRSSQLSASPPPLSNSTLHYLQQQPQQQEAQQQQQEAQKILQQKQQEPRQKQQQAQKILQQQQQETQPIFSSSTAHFEMTDLLGEMGSNGPYSTIARNTSAPTFSKSNESEKNTGKTGLEDDFLLFSSSETTETGKRAQKNLTSFDDLLIGISTKEKENSNKAPPKANERQKGEIPRVPPPDNAFDDLLSAQGFSASSKLANRTLADLQREENIKDMDPIVVKVRDWTAGKERNIRALLGSLSNVLWEDAESRWVQPSMAELLSYAQIKKYYRKACLVVHPDKQIGKSNELLAKAIFTELNDAWTNFETSRQV